MLFNLDKIINKNIATAYLGLIWKAKGKTLEF